MVALGELPEGWLAYVDADWLQLNDGLDLPAILADPGGALRWRFPTASPLTRTANGDPDLDASRALAWTAERAVKAVSDIAGDVEVIGNGALALGIRRLLSEKNEARANPAFPAGARQPRPSAVILTTGQAGALLTATQQVVDLGRVVLASEIVEPFAFDLYPDVHARGLALVGLPGPLAYEDDLDPHPLESVYRDVLVRTRYGDQLDADARWFCFSRDVTA